MKKYFVALTLLVFIVSCDKKSKLEKEIEKSPPVSLKVYRFDKDFFETPPNQLPNLKAEYPFSFLKERPIKFG